MRVLFFLSSKRSKGVKEGFTLIELLVVITLITMIAGLTFFSLATFNDQQALDNDETAVRSMIQKARAYTQGSKDDDVYGVYFSNDSVELFRGSYDVSNIIDVHTLNKLVEIHDVSFSGSQYVTFTRLTGEPNYAGSLRLRLKEDISREREVVIHSTGLVE